VFPLGENDVILQKMPVAQDVAAGGLRDRGFEAHP
jgi:hypothetical protein